MRRNEIIIALIIFNLAMGFSIWWAVESRDANQSASTLISKNSDVKGESDLGLYPKVINIPPSTTAVGEIFSYRPQLSVKGGTADLKVTIESGPAWLFIEDGRIYGIPSSKDLGNTRIILKIWNGDIYTEYIFYLNVYEKESIDS